MSRALRKTRALLGAVLAVATLAACGPKNPLEVTLRGVQITVPRRIPTPAVDLVAPPAAQPALPGTPPLSLPAVELPAVELPPAFVPTTPPTPPPACPQADPLAVPAEPASVLVATPPSPGRYLLTQGGKYTIAGAGPTQTGELPQGLVREIKTATAPNSTSQRIDAWSISESDGTSSAVYVYDLVQPSATGQGMAAGIYLAAMSWRDPIRGALSYQPVGSPLLLFPLPAQTTTTPFVSAQTDPLTQTVISVTGQVTGKKRVDICGRVVDSYSLALTGTITTPTQQLQLDWQQQIATQFGGLAVEETLILSGPDAAQQPGDRLDRTATIRYTEVPEP